MSSGPNSVQLNKQEDPYVEGNCTTKNEETGQRPSNFPQNLYKVLSCPEYANIITWRPNGMAWFVLDQISLENMVLPKYFPNDSNYASFERQLIDWGFRRITSGIDKDAYFHMMFLRDDPSLVQRMTQTSSSTTRSKSLWKSEM